MHLSASRANDFLTCPLLFRYRAIDRLPEVPSAAALRGTLVHRALEVLFGLPTADRTPDAAADALAGAWAELAADEPVSAAVLLAELGLPSGEVATSGEIELARLSAEVSDRILEPARPLLDAYFAMEDPTRFQAHAMEMAFDVPIHDTFSIRGFVDRVDIAPTGQVRIIDYKTGKAPSAGFEAKAMFQMRFYALAWWRMTGQIPHQLRLMYLGSQESLTYVPEEADLVATERKVLALREAIAASAESGVFAAKASRLCDWCSYRDLCPAWGAISPPMPALPVQAPPITGRPMDAPPAAGLPDRANLDDPEHD
ncbi:MAG: PD-(D/E)XK nuclease family protein [Actinomycetales bacterium]|nr:PD-(D/E)XK nuclease family protein [Actinomycetales bacterium]